VKIILIILPFISMNANAQSLSEFYNAAVNNTAVVQSAILNEKASEYEKKKTYSNVLPTLSANSTTLWRDEVPSAGGSGTARQHNSYLNLSQPLFQGGSEYYALGIAKRLPKIARLATLQAEINLYNHVAEAFYTLIRIQRELRTLDEQENTLIARVRTLKKRARIGQNKKTDVLSAQSQLARVLADKAKTQSILIRAKAQLINLTGVKEILTLKDSEKVEKLKVPESWKKALQESPRLKQLQLELEVTDNELSATNGIFLPSVDLEGKYYLDRSGTLEDSKWDVSITAQWEIFSSGKDYSERKVALFKNERIKLELIDLKRSLINDYSSLKAVFLAQQKTVSMLNHAVKISKRSYTQHVKESNQGLVSPLDVLRALTDYLEVRKSYEQQIYEAQLSFVRLRSIAGVRP
jgi:outer membrane protein TolC